VFIVFVYIYSTGTHSSEAATACAAASGGVYCCIGSLFRGSRRVSRVCPGIPGSYRVRGFRAMVRVRVSFWLYLSPVDTILKYVSGSIIEA